MSKLFFSHVHTSQGGEGEQTFIKRLKNVIDAVFYSKKAYECYCWFVENQDVIVGLLAAACRVFNPMS